MWGEELQGFFEQVLFLSLGVEAEVLGYQSVGGGCINNATRLDTSEGVFFLKWNEEAPDDLFACEARGLALLRQHGPLPTPEVLGEGKGAQGAFLLLEFIEGGRTRADYWEELGRGLAAQHRFTATQFGLDHANYLGTLTQNNEPQADGWAFYISQRLRAQAGLALYEGKLDTDTYAGLEKLYEKLPSLLPSQPASLLHGDLWSGNVMRNAQGQACLLDPACYFGFREAELAFTQLFGGFDPSFYHAYQEAWPLEPGFPERAELYNLYPLLAHVNLFGEAYAQAVRRTVSRFVG